MFFALFFYSYLQLLKKMQIKSGSGSMTLEPQYFNLLLQNNPNTKTFTYLYSNTSGLTLSTGDVTSSLSRDRRVSRLIERSMFLERK